MQKIPMPDVLNADRIPGDKREEVTVDFHRARAENLQIALEKSCEYAVQLWHHLDAARGYLVGSLPSASQSGDDSDAAACAAPRGPQDVDGWTKWADAYAAITSVLAGPHGDSGFGREEAVREAQQRGVSV